MGPQAGGAAREAARDVERHERATANEALHDRADHEQGDHVEDQVRKVGVKHGGGEQTPPLAVGRARTETGTPPDQIPRRERPAGSRGDGDRCKHRHVCRQQHIRAGHAGGAFAQCPSQLRTWRRRRRHTRRHRHRDAPYTNSSHAARLHGCRQGPAPARARQARMRAGTKSSKGAARPSSSAQSGLILVKGGVDGAGRQRGHPRRRGLTRGVQPGVQGHHRGRDSPEALHLTRSRFSGSSPRPEPRGPGSCGRGLP